MWDLNDLVMDPVRKGCRRPSLALKYAVPDFWNMYDQGREQRYDLDRTPQRPWSGTKVSCRFCYGWACGDVINYSNDNQLVPGYDRLRDP